MGMFIHRRKENQRKAQAEYVQSVQTRAEASVREVETGATQLPLLTEGDSPTSTLTEEDINKLPFFSLKSLALQHGIDVTDKKTKQLRKELLNAIQEGK